VVARYSTNGRFRRYLAVGVRAGEKLKTAPKRASCGRNSN
jgi:hypothetical protein